MNQKLLFERLSRLKKDSFLRYIHFIKSPYFHNSEISILLIELIKPFYPDFNFPKNIEMKIKKLTPSNTAHSVLLSRMNDLLDEFELQEIYQKKEFLKRSIRYESELDKKNNLKYYYQLQQSTDGSVNNSDELYADFYKEFASIAVCENNWLADKEKIFYHSDRAMKNILHFFLSKYLMVYANKMTHAFNLPEESLTDIESSTVLNLVKENIEQQPLSVRCIFYIIQLYKSISNKNSEFDHYYEKLKQETFILESKDISYEIKYALLQASSVCVFKCYNEPEYFRNAFEISRFLIERELYFSDQYDLIIQQRFILVVKIALGAGETDWVEKFIHREISKMNKSSQSNIYNYALGLVYFHLQEYEKAVKLMVKIHLNTPQFISDYKITLLKMYYELDDLTGFNYQSQTFQKFLRKDKTLNKTHIKNILDSIEFIRLLFRYKQKKSITQFNEKLESKGIMYLTTNYRDKWFADKYAQK